MHADATEHVGTKQVRRLLLDNYTSGFQLHGSALHEKRAADLPLPDSSGNISAFGTCFGLEGFDAVVQQVHRRLLRLHIGFHDSSQFTRSLQLLRLVAAPGLGKVGTRLTYAALLVARCFAVTASYAEHNPVVVCLTAGNGAYTGQFNMLTAAEHCAVRDLGTSVSAGI